ncbi:hypothetical protein [Pseudomonas sp. BAY1663]|uniref:hypothetical protein n=1 Tax=Pseudomonas sp. BAY1663 TaxID=1439940 RepID=UPI0013E2F405|nr:hypothetical protein [Pseudomonas sp. BAY1663]
MTIETQPVYNVRPDKAAAANYDYFHVLFLAAVDHLVAAIDGFSMRAAWWQCFAAALGFH